MRKIHVGAGDLVHVKGYETLYYIDTINTHNIETSDATWSEIELDLTSVNGEYNFAYIEDIELVCRANHSSEYLRTGALTTAMLKANKALPTQKQQSATIDELLDIALDSQKLYKITGLSDFQAQEKAAYDLIKNLIEMSE
ncbi:hypothetical protein KC140_14045 [Listeria monocytogenes]|uniref:Uncharacterized protein n=1 Tax=Listeria monocytogenes TaxID=1639 RepID=A0A9P1UY46_LISMN|nr:hypothetical protein [Listeria monocytogenes]EAA0328910.1 hypothetical protein [Listeria monocytogenes]EAC2926869.1 hypothetical protein [Listeria monocytogenes]EAC2932865.1 hypothetical protein [Listeria monocytogenes]EAC3542311.1 hypothetical protein [Listeria monocytogenes]EAC3544293.1 hypothetical protein [Listeria monocytogenes]